MEAGAANATMQYNKYNIAIQEIQQVECIQVEMYIGGSKRSVTAKLTSQVSRNEIGPADLLL